MRIFSATPAWLSVSAVMAGGILVTVAGLHFLVRTRMREESQHQDRRIAAVVAAVKTDIARDEDLLRVGRSQFDGAEKEDARGWKEDVAALDLPGRHPGVKAFAYIVPVERADLPAYLADQAREGNPFQIRGDSRSTADDPHQGPPAPDLFVIQYLEPAQMNTGGPGLDVGAIPDQRRAAEAARDEGQERLTPPLSFRHLGTQDPAVGFYLPVYQGREIPAGVSDRRRRLKGWVSLALLSKPLFGQVLEDSPGVSTLEVMDVGTLEQPQPPRLLFRQGHPGPGAEIERLPVGGRIWELRFAPPEFASLRRDIAIGALTGLALTCSLATLVWSLAGTRARAEAFAEARTQDLRGALARHRAFLEQTPQGVVEFDETFRVTGWNPAAARIFGYSEEEALGRPGTFLVGEDQQSEVTRRWMEPLSKGESLQGVETHRAKDGRTFECEWRVTALKDTSSGGILGFTGLVEDATERLRLELERQQAQRLESLGVLAGGLAHDFNNLLMAIQGHAELAERAIEPEHRARGPLEKIQRAVERAAALAHQMLTYAGRARTERCAVDLNRLLLDLGDLLQVSVPKKAELVVDLLPGLPPTLADPTQLQQVAMNLITNGAEALPDGQGRLVLRTMTLDLGAEDLARDFPGQALAPGRYAALEVEDDGVGMDATTLAKIFEPFFTTKFKGRGLGLSAVMGIIRASGGGLRVRSNPGHGTVFTAAFPASDAPRETLGDTRSRTWERGGRALVVDDEEGIRGVLREFLSSLGFEVEEAEDGYAGLEALRRHQDFRIALVDLTMPGLSGLELLGHFRKDAPATRVVLMSGYSEDEVTDPGLPGGDAFLAKPFRLADLERVIQQVLEP